jgi:hypothetical protein
LQGTGFFSIGGEISEPIDSLPDVLLLALHFMTPTRLETTTKLTAQIPLSPPILKEFREISRRKRRKNPTEPMLQSSASVASIHR